MSCRVFAHEVCDVSKRDKDERQLFYLNAAFKGKEMTLIL